MKSKQRTAAQPAFREALVPVRDEFPALLFHTQVAVAATLSLLLEGAEGCVAIVFEGPPSSGKTTVLNFLDPLKDTLTISTDSFTPASFVSHMASVDESALQKRDFLPRIRHKTLLIRELAPVFSAHKEDLIKNVGILTRVLDGQGYSSDSGAHGQRGYEGDYRFSLLAATTPMRQAVWDIMANMGNRLMLVEVEGGEVTSADLVAAMLGESTYKKRLAKCAESIAGFVGQVWEARGGYGGVSWDTSQEDPELVGQIARAAEWVVKCRGTVQVDSEGEVSDPMVEAPHRLMHGLWNLARGHALACGRTTLAQQDVELVVDVALDSMPFDRRHVVRELLHKGELTSGEVEAVTGKSRPTAIKIMETLAALGAVVFVKEKGRYAIALRDAQAWLRRAPTG